MNFQHGRAPFDVAQTEHLKPLVSVLLTAAATPVVLSLRTLESHTRGHGLDSAADCFDAALEAVQDGINELGKGGRS